MLSVLVGENTHQSYGTGFIFGRFRVPLFDRESKVRNAFSSKLFMKCPSGICGEKHTSQYTNMQKYCRKLLAVWDNLLVALNHFINTLTLTITLLMYNSQFWCWPCTSPWLWFCFYSTFLPNSQPKLRELQLALLRQQMLLKVIVVVTLLSNKRQVRRRQFRQLGVKWLKNAGIKHKREE